MIRIIRIIRIRRFLVQTSLGIWPDLGTQSHYEALSYLWIKLVENAGIKIGLVRLSSQDWAKVGRRTVK